MTWFWITFRILHIVFGVLWVGSAFLFVAVIGPSAAEVGPSAGPLMQVAVRKRKVVQLITAFSIISVVAGWVMWTKHAVDTGLGDWVGSTYGLALTIGGVLATIAMFTGIYGVGGNVTRMVDIGEQVAMAGGPPSPEQGAEMEAIQAHLKKHGQTDLVLLLLAVLAMATAQYW